ncbi:rod shape-determining protein MreD [Oleispira antarctica]|uniref:Rod shape-determining protein MreD n=1 Tax=Oleispira antarctica TaxID=188908 RepID=A0A1Y5HSX5_OLEAN|nr:rod shape-determining protein MreD [Oleispira antarctica]
MSLREIIFVILSLCMGFILQYLPLADFMSWFVPQWVLMVFIFWQMHKPRLISFWWVWPIGLLLDVQQANFLGTSVVAFAITLYFLQLMYQRLKVFNVAQQTLVIFLLICSFQLVTYWSVAIVDDINKPLSLWLPSLVSALVWPWLYLLLSSMSQKLR